MEFSKTAKPTVKYVLITFCICTNGTTNNSQNEILNSYMLYTFY